MRTISPFTSAVLTAALLASTAHANGSHPGSVLVFPLQRGSLDLTGYATNRFWTIVSVTNVNPSPVTPSGFGGTTNVQFDYHNTEDDPGKPLEPQHCYVNDVVEALSPADTLSVLTNCHNASSGAGYLVVHAQDPARFRTAWSWDYLIGSEIVLTASGGMYSINAIPYSCPLPDGTETDLDGDGQLDFDGAEYQGTPDTLFIDSFTAPMNASLVLINLTGGNDFTATVRLDVWNDNEFPFSSTISFRCWFHEPLIVVSPVFSDDFLRLNTPEDPDELDVDCDGRGEFETGWAMISGLVASSTAESIPDPALLGALTGGPDLLFDGGRLLWESTAKQYNGDFLKFGVDDPEFP